MLTKLWTNSINAIQNDNGTAFFLQIVNVYFPFSVVCVRFSSLNFDCARFKWLILLFDVFLHQLIWQLSHFIGRSFLSAYFNRKISMQFFFAQQVIVQVFVFILFACGCQLWMLFVSFWVRGIKPRTIYSFYFKSINFQIDCSDWRFCLSFTFRFARLNILERKNWGNLNVCIEFFDRVNKHFSRGFCIGNISVVLCVCVFHARIIPKRLEFGKSWCSSFFRGIETIESNVYFWNHIIHSSIGSMSNLIELLTWKLMQVSISVPTLSDF